MHMWWLIAAGTCHHPAVRSTLRAALPLAWSATCALQPASLRLDSAIAVLEVTKEQARTSVHAFKCAWSLMHFKQNPSSNTWIRINHLSVSDRSVLISDLCTICRLIHWTCLQSSVIVSLPNCSIPKRVEPPSPSPVVLTGVQLGEQRVNWRVGNLYSHQPGQSKSSLHLQPPYIEEENLVNGEGPWKPHPAGKSSWYLG